MKRRENTHTNTREERRMFVTLQASMLSIKPNREKPIGIL
jgi:hypothetical protein